MNHKITGVLATLLMLITCTGSFSNGNNFTMPHGINSGDYIARTIIFRVLPTYRNYCTTESVNIPAVQSIVTSVGTTSLHKLFPNHQLPEKIKNEHGYFYADLSLIYQLEYSSDADLSKVINSLLQTGVIKYAEPKYLPTVSYIPNDPLMTANQQFLTRINAYDGWDVSKGDTNVIIGIVDTGTDWDHPDLEANLQLNFSDPINGIDDDNDGYVDNFRGWDLGENDNNPTVGTCFNCAHGSHVSGCAAAVTDNNTGVASSGFYSRFLPVKIANASGSLTQAYEGIVYAADHGCQIINCSWGGGGGGSFGQDIIDYATINKNALVIAAAGNNGSNVFFYPAAYNYVLCIAATNGNNDNKAGFSNYGHYVDVCAPGNAIYSTVFNNNYTSMNGTSMAAPVAAGVAAIVKSYFPSYSALQVGEQVRVTADDIYGLPQNTQFANGLGKGRVNLLNALTLNSPSVRMHPVLTTDNDDNVFIANDSLYITGDITNYLDATSALVVTLSSSSPYVTFLDNSTTIGVLGTMATVNNNNDPFVVRINANAPQNALITFKLTFQDGAYSDFQMFNVIVNVDYVNITVNDVWTTNTSKGRLCYNGTAQAEGLGFNYLNQGTLTYEAGFMAGTAAVVADNVRGPIGTDEDWQSVTSIVKNSPGFFSDLDTYGKFSDASGTTPMGLQVTHRSFSFSAPPHTRYHIFEYTLRNNNSTAISSLYAGIFSDWDIQNFNNNKSSEDQAVKMGYVWCTDSGGFYAGIKLLTPGNFTHYAIDNVAGGSGGIDAWAGGLDDAEKYTALSTNRATAGGTGTGNDVLDVVGTGPFNLAQNDSVTVAFALIAAHELSDLIASANAAQLQYNLVTSAESVNTPKSSFYIYPNPATDQITIAFNAENNTNVTVTLFDLTGRIALNEHIGKIATGHQKININTGNLKPGSYIAEIRTGDKRFPKKIILTGQAE